LGYEKADDTADCPLWWVFVRFDDAFCSSFVADLDRFHTLEKLDTLLHDFDFVIWKAAVCAFYFGRAYLKINKLLSK
jgi:hypothetical protein